MTTNEPTPRRDAPAWVFILIILLCLGGGVWFVYWYFSGATPATRAITLKPGQENVINQGQQGGNRRGPFNRGPNAGGGGNNNRGGGQPALFQVINASDTQRTYRVLGQFLTMDVVDHRNGEDEFTFRPTSRRLLNDEQMELARLRWRVLRDAATARYLNIADWQKERLQAVDTNVATISDEDKAKLIAAWRDLDVWNKSPSPESQRQVVGLLNEIGQRAQGPTKAKLVEQVEEIAKIITPEQLAAMKAMGTADAKSPPMPAKP